jgi:hypothetical protein
LPNVPPDGLFANRLAACLFKLPIQPGHARAPVSRIVFAAESSVPVILSTVHRYFPIGATGGSDISHFDSAVTAIMGFIDAFASRTLARPVVILVVIAGWNYAAGKNKRKHPDANQLIFHA